MRIGVPKERKTDETRVALRPDQAAKLIIKGHSVLIESGAGVKAGFEDCEYEKAGAKIVDVRKLFKNSKLILKVKCPLESEYDLLTDEHILFTYLHFDENIKAENISRIVSRGVTGIAYEWVEMDGHFPLLEPMSELTGAVFARKSMGLLMEHKGLLGGRYMEHWPSATAMVIGAGHIGCNAVNVFAQNHFRIILVDKHPETLKTRLANYVKAPTLMSADINAIRFDENRPDRSMSEIQKHLDTTDILICAAVRRQTLPKEKCEYLIRREDVSTMTRNSVICDATACDKDLIETCISSSSLKYTYVEEGVIHYNCDHIPALVAGTSTRILTEATFPYVEILADKSIVEAFESSGPLAAGVMCFGGKLTHEYSAKKKHLEFTPLGELIPTAQISKTRSAICATF
jgi:alanine dehydrogenase